MLDKGKIEEALLKSGLSTRRSKELADYLAAQDLMEDKKSSKKKDMQEVVRGG